MVLKNTIKQNFGFKVSLIIVNDLKKGRKQNVRRLTAEGCMCSAMTIVL